VNAQRRGGGRSRLRIRRLDPSRPPHNSLFMRLQTPTPKRAPQCRRAVGAVAAAMAGAL